MKVRWNEKYTTIAVYTFLVLVAAILFLFLLLNLASISSVLSTFFAIISPFIWGFAIAYILNRHLHFFEETVYAGLNRKKPRPKLVRGLSVTTVILLFILILAGLIWIILPQLVDSIVRLFDQLPNYFQEFIAWLKGVLESMHLDTSKISQLAITWEGFLKSVISYVRDLFPDLASTGINLTISVVSLIGNFFIALIASIYLMLSKEKFIMQTKKFLFGVFPQKFTERMILVTRESHTIFSNFISGKLLESAIVGVLTFVCMTIIGIDYALLISIIMGIFNLIPFFGPFIGAIPSALLLLILNPADALWFIILTLVLQQLDGQLIGPKILGDSTGLTAFWVIFAIVLGGGLFGVLGMILGIPLFAVFYSLVREFTNSRLEKKGLSTRASDYRSTKNRK